MMEHGVPNRVLRICRCFSVVLVVFGCTSSPQKEGTGDAATDGEPLPETSDVPTESSDSNSVDSESELTPTDTVLDSRSTDVRCDSDGDCTDTHDQTDDRETDIVTDSNLEGSDFGDAADSDTTKTDTGTTDTEKTDTETIRDTMDSVDTTGTEMMPTDTESADTETTSDLVDAVDVARVSDYIDSLPWGQSNIDDLGKRDELIDAVIRTCDEFAPPNRSWHIWCQAFLVSAACRESSLNPMLVNGGGNDPVVGLLQNRFSSTVEDYDTFGKMAALERIGCKWPDFNGADWAQDGIKWVEWMQDVRCNIAIGAWYYFYNATGNGDPPCYAYQYCQGKGVAGNLVIGMLSHLRGPAGAHFDPEDPYPATYVSLIKEWFDEMITPVSDPHPFIVVLAPNPEQYCENP